MGSGLSYCIKDGSTKTPSNVPYLRFFLTEEVPWYSGHIESRTVWVSDSSGDCVERTTVVVLRWIASVVSPRELECAKKSSQTKRFIFFVSIVLSEVCTIYINHSSRYVVGIYPLRAGLIDGPGAVHAVQTLLDSIGYHLDEPLMAGSAAVSSSAASYLSSFTPPVVTLRIHHTVIQPCSSPQDYPHVALRTMQQICHIGDEVNYRSGRERLR